MITRYVKIIFTLVIVMNLCSCVHILGEAPLAPEPTKIDLRDEIQVRPFWSIDSAEDLPTKDWVKDFDDSNLNELVAEALLNNRDIKRMSARVEAAKARIKISKADKKPTVDGQLVVARNQRGNDIFASSNNININSIASWEWDLWGRIRDRITASELDLKASEADLTATKISIVGQVTQTWLDLIEAKRLATLSEIEVERRKEVLDYIRKRAKASLTQSSDVSLTDSALASAEAALAERFRLVASNARILETLLSRYPAQEIEIVTNLPNLPPLTGAGKPEYVLSQRPDLLAIEARLYSQGLAVDDARRSLRPTLRFSANPGLLGTGIENTFSPTAFAVTVAASLTGPIYQGGRLRADVTQQKALLREQIENYASTALTAFLEVENGLESERRLLEQEIALHRSVKSAREAEQTLEIRYLQGLTTITDFLDAQSRRSTADEQLVAIRKNRLSNRVSLHMALGGGGFTTSENNITSP